jgi:hypothetical protein
MSNTVYNIAMGNARAVVRLKEQATWLDQQALAAGLIDVVSGQVECRHCGASLLTASWLPREVSGIVRCTKCLIDYTVVPADAQDDGDDGDDGDEQDEDDEDEDIDYGGYDDEDDRSEFADPGGRSALRAATPDNPRNLPCPNCGEPDRLTPADKALGYQCDTCADRAEGLIPEE